MVQTTRQYIHDIIKQTTYGGGEKVSLNKHSENLWGYLNSAIQQANNGINNPELSPELINDILLQARDELQSMGTTVNTLIQLIENLKELDN